jgi:hypothetical protein
MNKDIRNLQSNAPRRIFEELIVNSFFARRNIAKEYALLVGGLIYIALIALACTCYPGSLPKYLVFTFSAALMLWLGLSSRLGYGAAVLTIFLWLGLWLKLTVNLILFRPYTEPIGGFHFSSESYDELLQVATLVCLGMSLAWLFSKKWFKNSQRHNINAVAACTTSISSYRIQVSQKLLWFSLFVAVILLNIANIKYGFVQSGLVPRKIFPWPTNAIACWLLYSGCSFVIAGILYWDYLRNKMLTVGILIAIFEAAIGGMTTISRGLYLWHVLPVFLAAWANSSRFSNQLSRRKLISLSALALVGFVVVGSLVNVFRNTLYDVRINSVNAETIYSTQLESIVEGGGQLLNLVVDRWVGVEGIMVAVGYPDKNINLFMELLTEKPGIGHVTQYQYISNSHYSKMDANKYQFATIPGVSGFLYLSGSLWIVLIGSVLLALSVTVSEKLIELISENPFFCAVSGVWMANMVAQIGVTPRQLLAQIAMNFLIIIVISLIQAYWFNKGWIVDKLIKRPNVL